MSNQQLSHELYKWLVGMEVLPATLKYKSNGNFELDTKSSQGMLSGFLMAKLLVQLANVHGANMNMPLFSSIKQSNTPAARVYNWNILAESFLKLSVTISKETQKEITSGNFSTLVRFLLQLHKKFNPKKAEKKEQEEPSQINLKKLQIMQGYSQAETFLQMVIMMISVNLNLTPKQTLSTLSENAKYYAHMVVKGIKNSFAQIMDMLDLFTKEMPKLMYLCERSPQKNSQFFLDLIKPTLISRDADVAKKGTELFHTFIEESLRYNSKNLIYQILCKENVGFDFLYMGLKRHPDLVNEFINFIFPLIKEAFKDFFEIHLKRTINNEQQYLKIVIRLLDGITKNPDSKGKLKQSGLLQIWLKSSEESFNNKKKKEENLINEQTKLLYLELLCNLWKDYSTEINENQAEELLMKGLEELKKNTRKDIYTIKIPALIRLFDFLHFLADGKNAVASILYKKIIFLFIQNHDQQDIREIFLSNFVIMIKKYPTIPIEFLLEPFLRQLVTSEGKTYILNVFDFGFMIELCKHPRMDASYGLSYLQYLSKIYIKSFIYSKIIIRIIEILTSRFCEEETIIEFIKKNVDSTLNLYGILMFNRKKLSKQDGIINKQKKSLALELIKHYITLEHQDLSMYILSKITALYIQWLEEKRYTDKGLAYLINLFGDVDEISMQYKINQNKKNTFDFSPPESEETIQTNSNDNSSKPTPKSEPYYERQYMKQKGMGYKMSSKPSKARMEQFMQRQNVKPNPKVLQDIEKIKVKLKDEQEKKKQKQSNDIKKINLKNSQNSIELLQRNLSLGYAKLSPLQQDKILFDFDSVKAKQLKMFTKFHPVSQLEQIDEETANSVLKQYSKEIKSLFLKYALISETNNRKDSVSMLSFTEVIKMLKQKNISNVTKVMASDLIASINYNKRKEKNVLSGIEQADFNEFLLKLTDYLIQEERSVQQMPFGSRLELLLKQLFKDQNFYEYRFRTKEDPKITKLKQILNSQDDSEKIEIPEGYKKAKENQVELYYRVSDSDMGIDARYKLGYQLTDWLIYRCLGLHVITPVVEIHQRYNLIQIPKPMKLKLSKQQTDPTIKYQPDGSKKVLDLINDKLDGGKKSQRGKRVDKSNQRHRSLSQKDIHKIKADPIEVSEQDRQKAIKRQRYVEKLKQNLQKLKQEKAMKQEEEKHKRQEEKAKEKKKEEQRKRYLQNNKEKIKQTKLKEQEDKRQKDEEEKQEKEKLKQQARKKELELLQKQKQSIKKRAQKLNDKRRELQNSREKKAQQYEKLAKQVMNNKNEIPNDKVKMLEIKNSLENGGLNTIITQYEKQFKDLFQNYWIWEKKRIDLNCLALMLKDFRITPQFLYPKTLAQTYKGISKGQTLDFQGFIECLTKCAYKSQKIEEQAKQSAPQQGINEQVLKIFVDKLRMNQGNYRQIIKEVKNHLS